MIVVPIHAFKDNYIWAIVHEEKHTFSCVDPGEAAPVLAYAKQHALRLETILLTHHHADHIAGTSDLLHAFPHVKIYGPADERIPDIHVILRNEDMLHLDDTAFRILTIPGHTRSHIAYQEPSHGWLFCGDTLFSAGCGRVFDGTLEQLFASLQLLKNLADDTHVYCGHEYTRKNLHFAATIEPNNTAITAYLHYLEQQPDPCSLPSTIALEKKVNPFFRTNTRAIQAVAQQQGLNPQDEFAIFSYLRALKDAF